MAKRSRKHEAAVQAPPYGQIRDWWWGALLVGAVIVAYLPVWQAGFIWDDAPVLTENPVITQPFGLIKIWTTGAADICPLTISTFWFEHKLWGFNPLPYHLVNVLLHACCAVLLWRILERLRIPGAWLGAALWALHPVQVESVAWITEMKNTESGLFFLLTIFFFLRALAIGEGAGSRVQNCAFTLVFAAAAMASKSSTVILPVVLGLCAWWMEGRYLWRNLKIIGPIFLMSLAAGLLSLWTQQSMEVQDPRLDRSWPERLAAAGEAVWFYLGKLIWPHPLVTIYPRWTVAEGDFFSYLPLLAVLIVLFLFWGKRQSWARSWFFGFAYFLLALSPVLGLVHMKYLRYALVADHFQYLASMGPLALAGAGLTRFVKLMMPEGMWLPSVLGAGLLSFLGILSWQHALVYENEESLWTQTAALNPNSPEALHNLGDVFFKKGDIDAALQQYQSVLKIDPADPKTHNNLGNIFLQKGDVDEAMAEYQQAVLANPTDFRFRFDLGSALLKKGSLDEAIAQFQKAVEGGPGDTRIRNALANALAQKGSFDEAIGQYQASLETNPDDVDVRNSLGIAFAQKGELDEAMAQFREALRIDPNYQNAQINLAKAQALTAQKAGGK